MNGVKKIFLTDLGSYRDDLVVCVGGHTKKELLAFLKQEKSSKDLIKEVKASFDPSIDTEGLFFYSCGIGIIWIRSGTTNIDTIGVLAHEVHHCVQRMVGIKRGMLEETETLAYEMEHLMRKILIAITD